jgi:hypothetical protein
MENDSLELWIARDECGDLSLFFDEPYLVKTDAGEEWFSDEEYLFCGFTKDKFPQVTFDNSPIPIIANIMNKTEYERGYKEGYNAAMSIIKDLLGDTSKTIEEAKNIL